MLQQNYVLSFRIELRFALYEDSPGTRTKVSLNSRQRGSCSLAPQSVMDQVPLLFPSYLPLATSTLWVATPVFLALVFVLINLSPSSWLQDAYCVICCCPLLVFYVVSRFPFELNSLIFPLPFLPLCSLPLQSLLEAVCPLVSLRTSD